VSARKVGARKVGAARKRAVTSPATLALRPKRIRPALLAWYRAQRRDLPWRRTRDPYAIWVSEIMLQQTRVETVIPFYERFLDKFPTVDALASADEDDVLAAWSGLGYYRRARGLHAAASIVAREHSGTFPDHPTELRALPGIGEYTAAAIASIAFGREAAAVDGNVVRVLARIHGLRGTRDSARLKSDVTRLAHALARGPAPGDWTQALMELGAMVCTPRAPDCARCPLTARCGAHADGQAERYPAPKTKKTVPSVEQITVLLERDGKWVLVRREPTGLWGGLWEPPTGTRARGESIEEAALRVARDCTGLELDELAPLPAFEHVLTHRRMQFQPFRARARGRLRTRAGRGYDAARWLAGDDALGMGVSAWTARLLRSL